MTDTNGYVDPAHLTQYQGVPVSTAIFPDLQAAGNEFRARGHTFSIVLPWGGYRPYAIQGEMRSDYYAGNYARFNLAPPPSPAPAPAGLSRHGYGRAIDVASNAPIATRDQILAKHNFHLWETSDRNHYEWGDALTPAAVSVTALTDTPAPTETKDDNMTDHILLEITNSDKSQQWALVSPDLSKFVPIWKLDTANSLSTRIIQGTALKSAFTDCSKDEWNGFRAAAGLAPDPKVG